LKLSPSLLRVGLKLSDPDLQTRTCCKLLSRFLLYNRVNKPNSKASSTSTLLGVALADRRLLLGHCGRSPSVTERTVTCGELTRASRTERTVTCGELTRGSRLPEVCALDAGESRYDKRLGGM
jgi:hypothetical protein